MESFDFLSKLQQVRILTEQSGTANFSNTRSSLKMPLLDLPTEIRASIFSYVVGSPSGIIALIPGTSNYGPRKPRYKIKAHEPPGFRTRTISLAFLRTCKRIYEDARDLLWQINVLDIESLVPIRYMRRRAGPLMDDLSHQLTSRVQHVRMEMQFLDFSTASGQIATTGQGSTPTTGQSSTLTALGSWQNLKTLTLLICEGTDTVDEELQAYVLENGSRTLRHPGFCNLLSCRDRWAGALPPPNVGKSIYHEHLDILRNSIKEGSLSRVERQVVMNLEIPQSLRDDESGRISYPCKNPEMVLEEIGTAFRCPVVVYGKICFQDGVLVHNPFTDPPNSGSRHISSDELVAIVAEVALLLSDIASKDLTERALLHLFICGKPAAFSTAPVRALLEKGATADGRAQLEARTDLLDAIREHNIQQFFRLLES